MDRTYKVVDRGTGKVLLETESIEELQDRLAPIYGVLRMVTHFDYTDGGVAYYHFNKVTPELLAMLKIEREKPLSIMDKVAGVIMLILAGVLLVGMGGGFG